MAVLKEYKVAERFKLLALKEREKEVETQRSKKYNKVMYLARKKETYECRRIENKKDTVSKLCSTIDTSDREIPQDYNREPRIYGGVKVTEEEKAALTLPPKYTLYEKVNKQTAAVEIESMTAKYLWELNKEKENDYDEYGQMKEVSGSMNGNTSRSMCEVNVRNNDCLFI